MTKLALRNALLAVLYIGVVVTVMMSITGGPDPDTFLLPVAMLSLLTLSAAVMGYLFVFQPLRMYLDGQKQQAVDLFLRTVGIFAVVTAFFLAILFAVVRQ